MQPPQITIDQAKFLSGLMAARFDHEHETTKRVIEAVPSDKGDYRPDPFAKTAIELAWHIAASEQRFLHGICSGSRHWPRRRAAEATDVERSERALRGPVGHELGDDHTDHGAKLKAVS